MSAERPRVGAVLLDIEGTTTPLRFVQAVLFPHARAHAEEFLRSAPPHETGEIVAALAAEHEQERSRGERPPPWRQQPPEAVLRSALDFVSWLMDRDRKSTALKALQGRIWEAGYRSGALRGELYPDVPAAIARWRAQGRDIAIFSSGSVLAQKLLFGHTAAGDLTPHIRAWFDTVTGPKRQAQSYRRIAFGLQRPPAEVVFISDVAEELDAAREAGLQTALCARERASAPPRGPHRVVHDLSGICP